MPSGGAERGPQGVFNDLAVGVQLFLVPDLGADQHFRLPGDLLHGDFALDLALQRRANLLHRRLLIETQIHERAALEVDAVAQAALHRQTDQSRYRQNQRGADERPLLAQKVEISCS